MVRSRIVLSWLLVSFGASTLLGGEIRLVHDKPDPYGSPRPARDAVEVPLRTSFYFELELNAAETDDRILADSVTLSLQAGDAEAIDLLLPNRRFADPGRGWLRPRGRSRTDLAVYVDPGFALQPGTDYIAQIIAASQRGLELAPQQRSWRFRTEDAAREHPVRLSGDLSADPVHWHGGFFDGICNVVFCTRDEMFGPQERMMAEAQLQHPRAWRYQRDIWMTATDDRKPDWHLFAAGGTHLRRFDPPGTPVYFWERLDRQWDLAHVAGGRRLVVNFVEAPSDLSLTGRPYTRPKDYAVWHEVVHTITGHLIDRYGDDSLDFAWSVFNEPDLVGDYWRFHWDEVQRFYDYTTDAVLRAFEDHGYDSTRVRVGGWELGAIFGTNLRLKEILAHCSPTATAEGALEQNAAFGDPRLDGKRSRRVEKLCGANAGQGSPCDFVSIHTYNRSEIAAAKLIRAKQMALEADAAFFRDLWIDSHESCPNWSPPPDEGAADSYLGNGYFPSWCLDVVHRQLQQAAEDERYVFGESVITIWPPPQGLGGVNALTRQLPVDEDKDGRSDRMQPVPNPIFHALNLLSDFGPDYWVLSPQQVDGHTIGGFASREASGRIRVALFSHHGEDIQSRSDQAFQVALELSAVDGKGPLRVTEFRLDREHNTYFEQANRLRHPPAQELREDVQALARTLESGDPATLLQAFERIQELDATSQAALAPAFLQMLPRWTDPDLRRAAQTAMQNLFSTAAASPPGYARESVEEIRQRAALQSTNVSTVVREPDGTLRCNVSLRSNGVNFLLIDSETVAPTSETRTNVLLIMTDDQGWGDIQSHGNERIRTPVMDAIADQGARFDRFYVSPVFAPTRASLLTGRYHLRCGVSGVTRGYETMRTEELTIAEALKTAGYTTGCFGKWHNGRHYPVHPNGQGFDEFFGFCGGHWQQYFDTHLEHNGQRIETQGYITDVITDAATRFIEQNVDQPWFCYVPYNAPHSPWEVPDRYWDKYGDEDLDDRTRCVYAMVDCLDESIGRLLRRLDELGLSDDTIVLFLTDNGPNGKRYNGGMRGTKGSVHEGGVRVPLFIRWPSRIEPGTVIQPIAAHIDLLPTILDMCRVPKPEGPPIDGRSLWPQLQGEPVQASERMIFTDRIRNADLSNPVGSVRTQRWRAVREQGRWSLFDMRADPGQTTNVASQHPAVRDELSHAFDSWLSDATSGGLDYVPIPIGHPQRPATELPANEAFLTPNTGAGINYVSSPGFANAWIVDWTDTRAYPRWHVQVLTPGSYRISLLYNCTAEDVGARVRVAIGDRYVEGQVTRAFAPSHSPARTGCRRRTITTRRRSGRPWRWGRCGWSQAPPNSRSGQFASRVVRLWS